MSWLGKVKTALAIAGAFIVALGIAVLKGRAEGRAFMEAEQQRKRDALQDEYDRIDAGPVDPGKSYDGLRERSRGR